MDSFCEMSLKESDLLRIQRIFHGVSRLYLNNSDRHNYFLSVCKHLASDIDLEVVNEMFPYGGMIGINNSMLDVLLGRLKVFRLHAVLHDGCGYMKSHQSVGPGYTYAMSCGINNCLLGHMSGLSYCIYLKLFNRRIYHSFQV